MIGVLGRPDNQLYTEPLTIWQTFPNSIQQQMKDYWLVDFMGPL